MKSYTIGVDVGGTNIKLGIVHLKGKVIARTSFPTKPFASHKLKLIAALAHEIEGLIAKAGLFKKDIAGVGIGLPGIIDQKKGVVRFLPNIPGWNNVPLKSILQKKLKLPVCIENDVKMITLAEWKFGAGRGVQNLVCLTLGTGIGSGLILDGRLYRGTNNAAGELGHVPLNEHGPECNCGGSGCLEAYLGNRRLFAHASQVMGRKGMTTESMFTLANQGNAKALRFWRLTAERLGNGLVGVVNLLNPQRIVIGGGISNNHKYLLPVARQVILRRCMSTQAKTVKVVRASLGDDAGIIGAHVLVHHA